MKRIIFTCLMAILVTVAPALAGPSPVMFAFTFTGSGTGNYVKGLMALNTEVTPGDKSGLLNPFYPGLYVWDPTGEIGGPSNDNLVQSLSLDVYNDSIRVGHFTRDNYYGMIFDIQYLLTVNLSYDQALIGQATATGSWGSGTDGAFKLYAILDNSAPTSTDPYEIYTENGSGIPMQLTQFDVVPEPSTYVLLAISLGVVGYVRRKMVKCEG